MTSGICLLFVALIVKGILAQDHASTPTTTMGSVQSTQRQNATTTATATAKTTTAGHAHQEDQSSDAADACTQSAKRNLQDNLGRNYPQFQFLTSNLTAPREFYQKLFNQSFTKDTYQQYCSAYKTNRAELDKCANTTAKTLALIQLSFPDYVCIKRVNEYADTIVCLQGLNNNADVYNCRANKCASNEQNSINAKNPPANATKAQLTQYAVGDCLYAKCTADCRKTAIEKTCGADKSEMELEALKVAFSSAQSISQSLTALQMAASNALQDIFPDECRDAASAPVRILAGAGADYLSAAVNGTQNLLQSIQSNASAAGLVLTTTKQPGGGGESFMKSAFASSVVLAVAMTKLLV